MNEYHPSHNGGQYIHILRTAKIQPYLATPPPPPNNHFLLYLSGFTRDLESYFSQSGVHPVHGQGAIHLLMPSPSTHFHCSQRMPSNKACPIPHQPQGQTLPISQRTRIYPDSKTERPRCLRECWASEPRLGSFLALVYSIIYVTLTKVNVSKLFSLSQLEIKAASQDCP